MWSPRPRLSRSKSPQARISCLGETRLAEVFSCAAYDPDDLGIRVVAWLDQQNGVSEA